MNRYVFEADVRRVYEDSVTISVQAGSEDEARDSACRILIEMENEDDGRRVYGCYTDNRNTLHSEVLRIERINPDARKKY